MLLIDESGDLIQRKGSFEKIRIIVGIAEKDQDIPVAEALIPDERCNGSGNFIDLAAPLRGFQDMEAGIRSYRGTFTPAERERPAAEEMLRHLLQTERTEADRLLQHHRIGMAFLLQNLPVQLHRTGKIPAEGRFLRGIHGKRDRYIPGSADQGGYDTDFLGNQSVEAVYPDPGIPDHSGFRDFPRQQVKQTPFIGEVLLQVGPVGLIQQVQIG